MSLIAGYQPPGATVGQFLASRACCRALIGPRRGGRKVAAVADIYRRVMLGAPAPWRVAVATARADDLVGTAMRAVGEAFGREVGHWDMAQRRFAVDLGKRDGRRPLEFRFFGLDRPEQRRRWDATEATIVWLAGARDLAPEICDQAVEMAGSWADGAAAGMLIVTSRMPAAAHWIAARFAGDDERWQLFRQPGGRDARAENLAHLAPAFYVRLAARLPARAVASEVDGEWREPRWDAETAQRDPGRVALAALWAIRGGFPPATEEARR